MAIIMVYGRKLKSTLTNEEKPHHKHAAKRTKTGTVRNISANTRTESDIVIMVIVLKIWAATTATSKRGILWKTRKTYPFLILWITVIIIETIVEFFFSKSLLFLMADISVIDNDNRYPCESTTFPLHYEMQSKLRYIPFRERANSLALQ